MGMGWTPEPEGEGLEYGLLGLKGEALIRTPESEGGGLKPELLSLREEDWNLDS